MELGIRELRAALATTVRRAGDGQPVVITVGGRPVAQLGPLTSALGARPQRTLDDLAYLGLLLRARRSDPPPEGIVVVAPVGTRLDRLLGEVR